MSSSRRLEAEPEYPGKTVVSALPSAPVITMAQVWDSRQMAENTFLLTIDCPEVAKKAWPGSFVKLRAWKEDEGPLLDRPLSIHRVLGDHVQFLYRVVGRATTKLSQLRPKELVKISGPLGRGLAEYINPSSMYLVAGGIALAPMALVRDWLGTEESHLFYGERTGLLQVDENWLSTWAGNFTAMAEEEPAYGHKGLVTEPLTAALEHEPNPIFACGSISMLRAVNVLAQKYEVPLWVLLEAGMACGFGVCLTCNLPLKEGGYFRVCHDGPVVDALTVDWEKI